MRHDHVNVAKQPKLEEKPIIEAGTEPAKVILV